MRLEDAFSSHQTDLHIEKKIKYANNRNYVKHVCIYNSAAV